MEFRDLEYFVVLAEHQHVGRAAEALGLSQPALSLSLRRLENSMQTKLVKRTPKGVELTAVGSALLSRVYRLRLARQDVVREVADLSQGRAGDLRIGASPGSGENLIAEASSRLLRLSPNVRLKVTTSRTDVLVLDLRNGELDFVVANAELVSHNDFVTEYLFRDEFVAYVSDKHELAKRRHLALADLAQERWAVSGGNEHMVHALNQAFARLGLPLPRITVESNSTALRLRMVASGKLIGYSSRQFLQQIDPRYRLVELPVKEVRMTRRVGLSFRKESYLSPAAQRFIEILKAAAKEIAAEKP